MPEQPHTPLRTRGRTIGIARIALGTRPAAARRDRAIPAQGRRWQLLGAVAWAAGLIGSAGCAMPDPLPGPVRFQKQATGVATGDWDDLEAAVIVGASQSEMAIVRLTRPSDREAVFELRTITDEDGRLVATLIEPEGWAGRIELRARIGRFGSLEWERRLIDRVSRRLTDLHGVDVAPIR